MQLHSSMFNYLKPTDSQVQDMTIVREAAKDYCDKLEVIVPEGPDKTYLMRKLREVAMWANIAITRLPDGTPRE